MKTADRKDLEKALIEENTDFTDSENKTLILENPKKEPEKKKEAPKKQSTLEEWSWLYYSFGGCIFAAIGQFMMDWMSMGFSSRFTIALGDFIFVAFYGLAKYLYNSYKKKSLCSFSDSEWCDPKTGKWKEGTFTYLFLCMCCRFGYGFLIIYALYLANDCQMNGGLLFSIRTSEALFVAIWTRIFLKEKLTKSKILGLVILIAGVIGLSIPSKDNGEHSGFSILAAMLALLAALVSSLRNYSVKFLGRKKIGGDNITFGAVMGADFATVIVGAFLCIWGLGFNANNYNNYYKEYMDEMTWQRFLWSLFVGFSIYFSLSFTASGNQKGYAGPAVAIKNSSIVLITFAGWFIMGHEIGMIQWIFIGVIFIGLVVISAGEWFAKIFLRIFTKNKNKSKEELIK